MKENLTSESVILKKPVQRPDKGKTQVVHTDNQKEIGGPHGPEPTRYGDWEVKGRCSDF